MRTISPSEARGAATAGSDALVAVGLSHRTAPIDVRERFALGERRRTEWVENLTARPGVSECVVLSTCNRTECYLAGSDAETLDRLGREALCEVSGLGAEGDSYLATLEGARAVRHLFRVTGGLESLIVGEPQIQGQVRGAYRDGRPMVGPVLHRLFQSALEVGGRVRADTSIASGVTSIPGAAVDLARKVFGSLDDRSVLVLGTGEMGRLTVQCLKRGGARRVFLASRDPVRAERVSRPLDALPMRRSAALEALDRVDLVVACTESEAAFLRAEHLRGPRSGRARLVILDIAVPRNVDPRVAGISDVFLYNIDDLRQVVDRARAAREYERECAETIIERHVAKYRAWRRSRRADPAVRALRDTARRLVADAVAARAPDPDDADEALRLASHAALNKVLHGPTRAIRWLAERSDGEECLRRVEPWLGEETREVRGEKWGESG
ncbi:glutamyl-tRNA reductase [Candidatus Palauibacter polyketidifaciens]|uniref:glutamyl-tRNA reductase n=1 Tax=Candidatus Palauibacter polyketidifaciens TaxID=3056740 RepID=UPI0023923761|nr:glutamyl-tRNA reductase [Candidatus Palauibacter polyketidifaciens]MDE2721047.1 glutamyl-tRNA reductase [Candidatus Palauibacter polyketidifaciens]